MDKIRQQIQSIRAATGFSQADIARRLGVPPKTLGDWLLGRTRCRHQQMLALALEALAARWRVDDSSPGFREYLKEQSTTNTPAMASPAGDS